MIRLNNRDFEWQEGMTVKSLMELKKFTYPKIMVSINEVLIDEMKYGETPIRDNDDVKIIHLLAGG